MLTEVNRRDRDAFLERSREMSQALRDEIRNADTGRVMQALLAGRVTLIKSMPLDAAQRVHDLTIKGLQDSTRAARSPGKSAIRRGGGKPREADRPHGGGQDGRQAHGGAGAVHRQHPLRLAHRGRF